MSMHVCPIAGIVLWIGDSPWEPSKDHTHENDGYAPHVRLARVVILLREDLWGEVGIAADDAVGHDEFLARVVENCSSAEIDELDDVVGGHDTVVEFQVAVCETHAVEVRDTLDDLAEDTIDLWSAHLARHDDAK